MLSSIDFENTSVISPAGWDIGSAYGGKIEVSKDKTQNHIGSNGSLKATYPHAESNMYVWASFPLTKYNTEDIYVEFDVKIPNKTGSAKFFKVFGQAYNGNAANTTFGISGDQDNFGNLTYIGFGDGVTMNTDVNNSIKLDGEDPNWIGRSFGSAKVYNRGTVFSSWGNTWHHFKIHVKFNSHKYNYTTNTCISENNDGEYYLEIDNVVYVDAKGLFNHHCISLPIEKVNLLDWGEGTTGEYIIYLDNIKVSTGGFSNL